MDHAEEYIQRNKHLCDMKLYMVNNSPFGERWTLIRTIKQEPKLETFETIDVPDESEKPEADPWKQHIDYVIPMQSEKECERHNQLCRKLSGDNFTPIVPTIEHVDRLLEQFMTAFQQVASEGGMYTGDAVRVRIEIEYEPENK